MKNELLDVDVTRFVREFAEASIDWSVLRTGLSLDVKCSSARYRDEVSANGSSRRAIVIFVQLRGDLVIINTFHDFKRQKKRDGVSIDDLACTGINCGVFQ